MGCVDDVKHVMFWLLKYGQPAEQLLQAVTEQHLLLPDKPTSKERMAPLPAAPLVKLHA